MDLRLGRIGAETGYLVSWCVGHLVELSVPESYDERYSKWRLEDLPILPDSWLYQVSSGTKKQFGALLVRWSIVDIFKINAKSIRMSLESDTTKLTSFAFSHRIELDFYNV